MRAGFLARKAQGARAVLKQHPHRDRVSREVAQQQARHRPAVDSVVSVPLGARCGPAAGDVDAVEGSLGAGVVWIPFA